MVKKNQIIICQGSSCFSRGNKENLKAIQSFLSSVKSDSDISFKGQLCTSNCQQSPVILVNDKLFTNVQPKDIETILTDNLTS